MMKALIPLLILAAVLVVGCSGGDKDAPPTPEPTPSIPPPPPAIPTDQPGDAQPVAPVEGSGNVIQGATDLLGGGDREESGSKVSNIACDPEMNKITFTLKNEGIYTWSLEQDVSFTDTGDRKNVKVFINGFEANRGTPQYHPQTREVMFGPAENFVDNCDKADVAPGESVTCTLMPVKLNQGTGSGSLREVNEIWTDSPSVDDYIEFTC